jgi:UDP-N-acetylglucosamine 2-epimerase
LTDVVQAGAIAPDIVLQHPDLRRHSIAASIYRQLAETVDTIGRPATELVYLAIGDTTTSFMTASAAVAAGVGLAHVEAGIRSYPNPQFGASIENRYRRMIGQVSELNLCVLSSHADNLAREGAPGPAVLVGDLGKPMPSGIAPMGDRVLVHVHKAENASAETIGSIVSALEQLGAEADIIANPSIAALLKDISRPATVDVIAPLGHDELLRMMSAARVIVTDSGSTQREAALLGRRCVVRRDTAGWTELFEPGGHVRVGKDAWAIGDALQEIWMNPSWSAPLPAFSLPGGIDLAVQSLREFVA